MAFGATHVIDAASGSLLRCESEFLICSAGLAVTSGENENQEQAHRNAKRIDIAPDGQFSLAKCAERSG